MKVMKKILTSAIALTICGSVSAGFASVNAENVNRNESLTNNIYCCEDLDINKEIVKALNAETEYFADLEMSLSASMLDNGKAIDNLNVYTTTSKINNASSYNINNNDIYATTIVVQSADSKYSTGANYNNTYNVQAYMTIVWIDKFGPGNILERVYGGWSIDYVANNGISVSLSNRSLKIRGWDSANSNSPYTYFYPSYNTFSYSASECLGNNNNWLLFEAESKVYINSNNTLTLHVETSMFD